MDGMQSTPYLIPWFVSAILTFLMGVLVIRRRENLAARPFIAICLFATIWAGGYIFELGSTSLAVKLLAVKIEYIGIIGVPLSWTAFALAHTGRGSWLVRRNVILAAIFPFITLLVVWTNELHFWFFTEISTTIDPVTGLLLIWNPPGWWFWLHAIYIYGILVFGTYFLLAEFWNRRDVYRSQTAISIIAILLPWAANGAVIFRLLPIQIDITSVTFSISILLLGWGIFYYGLLDIAPVAHRAVFESISDSVIVLDTSLRIVELNPAAANLFNLSPKNVIGKSFQEHLRRYIQISDEALRQHGYHREIILQNDSKHTRWLDLEISSLQDTSNRHSGQIVTLRDVTRLKENESALAIARDEAMHASTFKDKLLANVSHELRTPLGIILGYTDLLDRGAYGEINHNQTVALQRIKESTQYLDKLVSELLDQAQLDSGRLKLSEASFEVREVLGKTCNQLSVLAEAKNISFQAEISEDMPISIVGDSQRLKQILVNLISNAIKFTEAGGVTVQICRTTPTEWKMQVADTGPGIPAESIEAVFEPFKQLSEANRVIRKGYGLGLSITKQILALMNGNITVESKVGKGTIFTITLPLIEPAA